MNRNQNLLPLLLLHLSFSWLQARGMWDCLCGSGRSVRGSPLWLEGWVGGGRGLRGFCCHMSLSGGLFVPWPACLFSLSSESCFTHRCLIQREASERRECEEEFEEQVADHGVVQFQFITTWILFIL